MPILAVFHPKSSTNLMIRVKKKKISKSVDCYKGQTNKFKAEIFVNNIGKLIILTRSLLCLNEK
jgi:DNA-binding protein